MVIIGVEEKQGVYEGNAYHNAVFHGTVPIEHENGVGLKPKSVKVKFGVLSQNFGKALTTKEILSFVGKQLNFFYDEYKNVIVVQVVENKSQG
jgi:hypothetical protein